MGRFVPPTFCGFAGEISNLQVGGRAWDEISCLCSDLRREGRSKNNLLVQQLGTRAAMHTHATQAIAVRLPVWLCCSLHQ